MADFSVEIRDEIARVTFNQGGLNTLSRGAVESLNHVVNQLTEPLKGVMLTGNAQGLGAGANIAELMAANSEELAALIDGGHQVLFRIEESPFPWIALVDGVCLGGVFELALACRAIVATKRSSLGFPEMRLNIFPGLGGTQRLPRRIGLVHPTDPMKGEGALSIILQGKSIPAESAFSIGMIDALIPEGIDPQEFARTFLLEKVSGLKRPDRDFSMADQLVPVVLPTIQKATMGRDHPRAPFVALDVIIQGVKLPLRDAIKLERNRFLEVASSSEAKAGMRFFFTQQRVTKRPPALKGVALRPVKVVGVDGFDGYMGNAIAFLARRAGYRVIGHVPVPELAPGAPQRMREKYQPLIQRGRIASEVADAEAASVTVTTDLKDLFPCDLIIEARKEDPDAKAEFYRHLAKGVKKEAIICSNSSSMGPGFLSRFFAEGGGEPANVVNLHFFSPAEHPLRALVEVIRGKATAPEVLATAHEFVRKIGKVPVILEDGSTGFLVNACLAEYFLEAENLFRDGTPIEVIDRAMREQIFPLGPFELADQAGIDVAAGMFDVMVKEQKFPFTPLVCALRDRQRFGMKTHGGFYNYENGTKKDVWVELEKLIPGRRKREASAEEIVERCVKALWHNAKELLERGIVASEEEADLAFIYGIGFAMYLGGPFFYARQKGWEK